MERDSAHGGAPSSSGTASLDLRLAPIAFLALVALVTPEPARAHAIVLASTPPSGGTVAAGPVEIEIRYNSRVDHGRSTLRVAGPARKTEPLPLAIGTAPDILRSNADLPAGDYVLHWQVLAIDGHVTRGEIRFKALAKP